jgi:hypothetical protein
MFHVPTEKYATPLKPTLTAALASVAMICCSSMTVAQTPMVDVDDSMRPLSAEHAGPMRRPPTQAEQVPGLPASQQSLAQRLGAMSAAERANTEISAEPMKSASAEQINLASMAAELWNSGQYEQALAALKAFEGQTSMALGLSYREPPLVEGGIAGFGDTTIHTDDATGSIALDVHKATGNLYAVVQEANGWELYRSANGGVTWTNTYSWGGIPVEDLDMAIVGSQVYVGYVATGDGVGDLSDLRVRRASTGSGAIDVAYGFVIAHDAAPNTIEEIAAASNVEDFNTNIFFAALESNDSVGYHWDTGTDGTTWTEISTGFVNAESGLDLTLNPDGDDFFLFISYIGNDGTVKVARRESGIGWSNLTVEPAYDGTLPRTALSAWQDTVIVAYRDSGTNGMGVRYQISYDGGDNWLFGNIYAPGPADTDAFMFDVCARGGFGTSAIFTREAGAVDQVMFTKRSGYASGLWDAPIQINDVDFVTTTTREPDLNWVATLDGSSNNYRFGIVYPQPDPMFDRRQHCDGDVDESGSVNVDDLIAVILDWGVCAACPPSCESDIAPFGGDCNVNVDDLIEVILSWGTCP